MVEIINNGGNAGTPPDRPLAGGVRQPDPEQTRSGCSVFVLGERYYKADEQLIRLNGTITKHTPSIMHTKSKNKGGGPHR